MMTAKCMYLAEFACHVKFMQCQFTSSFTGLPHVLTDGLCGLHNACILSVFDLHVDSCVEAGGVLEYCASTTLITYIVYTYCIECIYWFQSHVIWMTAT